MIILVDMDGVVADFEEGHQRMCRAHGIPPEHELKDRTVWDILGNITDPTWQETIKELWHAPGFFAGLRAVPEAIETLHEWTRAGHNVQLCTAPLLNSETCAQEKLAWVRQHVGIEFVRRTIITADKTLVHGDFLLDDRPDIKGAITPTWRHLLYAAPYNRNIQETVTWKQAREIIQSSRT
jgi:5'-nucleotidase